jgi:hypothetical protein
VRNCEADFEEAWLSAGQAGEGDPNGVGAGGIAHRGMGAVGRVIAPTEMPIDWLSRAEFNHDTAAPIGITLRSPVLDSSPQY